MKTKIFTIGLLLLSMSLGCFGQSRQEKTEAIIGKLKLVENLKRNFKFQLEPLKYQATGKDSLRVIELENSMTETEILKRISSAFNQVFSEKEINEIYEFTLTSAYEKFFNSGMTNKNITAQFKDVNKEIAAITKNFSQPAAKPKKKFEPIPVDRENGFYATVDYSHSTADKDIKLEDTPSLTVKDILEVKKVINAHNKQAEISIVFTKEGARKFYLLTKENIGKPIVIVIAKQIVSMPKVIYAILSGKSIISGDFTEEEIDEMIEVLKEK